MMELSGSRRKRFGTRYVLGAVTSVDLRQPAFHLHFADGQTLTVARRLIIATAPPRSSSASSPRPASWLRRLGVRDLRRLLLQGKDVLVVGGGDTRWRKRTSSPSCEQSVGRPPARRAARVEDHAAARVRNPKIDFIWNTAVAEILGDPQGGGVTGATLRDVTSGAERRVQTDGVFMAIGHTPNSKIFEGQLEMDSYGYIVTKKSSTETSVPGVFACGDVQDRTYRQAVTAAGTGLHGGDRRRALPRGAAPRRAAHASQQSG